MTLLKRSHWTEMGHMRMNSMQKMGVKGAEGREGPHWKGKLNHLFPSTIT